MNSETKDAVDRWIGRLNTVLIEYLIFSAIDNKPTYATAIVEFSSELLQNVKTTTVYAIIRRSIELELIERLPMKEKADKTRGSARQYYELTTEGESYLNSMREYLLITTSDSLLSKLEGQM